MNWDTPFAEWEGCDQTRLDLAERWGLASFSRLPGATCSQVFACEWQGQAAVLKIPNPEVEEADAWEALVKAQGRGFVKPFLVDEGSGAVLMPRLGGSMADSSLSVEDQVHVWCDLAEQIARLSVKLSVMSSLDYLGDLMPVDGPEKASIIKVHGELLENRTEIAFLHGDLHHYNILSSGEGWKAIDLKALSGEREFEAAAFLRNPIGQELAAEVSALRMKIMVDRLSFDPWRLWAWSAVQLWMNGWGEGEDDFSLSCRRTWEGIWSLRGEFSGARDRLL